MADSDSGDSNLQRGTKDQLTSLQRHSLAEEASGIRRYNNAGGPLKANAVSKPSSGDRQRVVRYKSVEANARFTATIATVLLALLFVEGVSLLRIANLLQVHVFIGMVLIPVVVLKIISTTYRFIKYYAGHRGFVQKGPPVMLLRILGPVIVVLTAVLLITGFALLEVPLSERGSILFLHKASFVLWFIAMAIHVLGHLAETLKFAPKDYYAKTRRQLQGAGLRQWTIAAALTIGVLLGALMMQKADSYFTPYLQSGSHTIHITHNGHS